MVHCLGIWIQSHPRNLHRCWLRRRRTRPPNLSRLGTGVYARGDSKPELRLHDTEPCRFDMLLKYVHGASITLDVEIATHLYHVADYYEVLDLRDHC